MRFLLISALLLALTPFQIECLFDSIQEALLNTEKYIESYFEDRPKHGQHTKHQLFLEDDGYLTTMELCHKHGYRCEEHYVETTDGYILKIHRLVGRLNQTEMTTSKPTLLLIHGIFGASSSLLVNGQHSPGGILSDYGYDVWLGNSRGNRYGLLHKTLSRDNPEFWDFNYNELSVGDYTSILNYILAYVNKDGIHCVGYSQGGMLVGSLLAFNPSLNTNIRSLSFVASALTLRPFKSRIFNRIVTTAQRHAITRPQITSNPFEVFSYSLDYVRWAYRLCNSKALSYKLCLYLYEDLNGSEDGGLSDLRRLPYYVSHYLNGASSNAVIHLAQCYFKGKLCLFDYGIEKNVQVYGDARVPELNFTLVTPPKIFIYGTEDHVVNREAIRDTLDLIDTSTAAVRVVEVQGYNHMHFIYGYNIKENVYDIVAEHINRYE